MFSLNALYIIGKDENAAVVCPLGNEKLVSTIKNDLPISVTIEGDVDQTVKVLKEVRNVVRVEVERRLGDGRADYRVYTQGKDDVRSEISRAVVDAGFDLIELILPGASLEDVFLRVISPPEN